MQAARKLVADFWKKSSLPPPPFVLLQGFYQSLGCFHCSSQVADVLLLNRIYSSGILYIDEVNNVELTVRRSVSGSLVLPVMVIELGC